MSYHEYHYSQRNYPIFSNRSCLEIHLFDVISSTYNLGGCIIIKHCLGSSSIPVYQLLSIQIYLKSTTTSDTSKG